MFFSKPKQNHKNQKHVFFKTKTKPQKPKTEKQKQVNTYFLPSKQQKTGKQINKTNQFPALSYPPLDSCGPPGERESVVKRKAKFCKAGGGGFWFLGRCLDVLWCFSPGFSVFFFEWEVFFGCCFFPIFLGIGVLWEEIFWCFFLFWGMFFLVSCWFYGLYLRSVLFSYPSCALFSAFCGRYHPWTRKARLFKVNPQSLGGLRFRRITD